MSDGDVAVIDSSTLTVSTTLVAGYGARSTGNAMAVSADGKRIYVADGDDHVSVIDAQTDQNLTPLTATGLDAAAVAVNGNDVYAIGSNNVFVEWNATTGAVLRDFALYENALDEESSQTSTSIAVASDGTAYVGTTIPQACQGMYMVVIPPDATSAGQSSTCSIQGTLLGPAIIGPGGNVYVIDDPIYSSGETYDDETYEVTDSSGLTSGLGPFGDTDLASYDGLLYQDGSGTQVLSGTETVTSGYGLGVSIAVDPATGTVWEGTNGEGVSGVEELNSAMNVAATVNPDIGNGDYSAIEVGAPYDPTTPIVDSVSPDAGTTAGGTRVTVTGQNFTGATSVTFTPSGQAAVAGSDVTVVSPDQLTVTTPDVTADLPSGATSLATDVQVTTPQGTSAVNAGDTYTFGCVQDPSLPDGNWDAEGCLIHPDPDDYEATQPSSLDGLVLTPSGGGDVDYSPNADDVTSSGSASVALNLTALSGSTLHVPISSGTLSLGLGTATTVIPLPANFTLAGMSLSGNLTFTPGSGGSVSATAQATLPAILGGGTGTASLVSTLTGGVTKLSVTATGGSLGQLFGLDAITLNYSSGTWTVAATATTPGGQKREVQGSLTYAANGTLSAGTITLSNISLGGLVTLTSFSLTYSSATGWTGSASLAQAKQSATISLTFNASGQLTAGSFHASGVTLFQVFDLTTFDLDYTAASSAWKLSIAVAHETSGASASADVTEVNGAVQGVDLDVQKIPLLTAVTLDELHLVYANSGGHIVYSASAKVKLPGAVVSGVDGDLTFTDGRFTHGGLTLHGNVPLFEVVYLTTLGAQVTIAPTKEISGTVGLSAGPRVDGKELLGLDGTLDYQFPTAGHASGVYTLTGSLSALSAVLGEGKITLDNGTAALLLTLGEHDKGFSAGKIATLRGQIAGHLVGHRFTAQGRVTITLTVAGRHLDASGTVTASNRGIVACGSFPALAAGESGFAQEWGHAPVFIRGDCAPAHF